MSGTARPDWPASRDIDSDDCREVAAAVAELAAKGMRMEPAALERARECLVSTHQPRRRSELARDYLHALDADAAAREAARMLREDIDAEVRQEAAWALLELGDAAWPVLLDLAHHRDASVRWYAYRSLRRVSREEAIALLIAGLDDPDFGNRLTAADALIDIGEAAFLPVLHNIAVRPPSEAFHRAALGVLRRVTPAVHREAVAPLLEDLGSSWTVYRSGFLARELWTSLRRPSEVPA